MWIYFAWNVGGQSVIIAGHINTAREATKLTKYYR